MCLERGAPPPHTHTAKTKLGQVGKKLGSFLSWLPTLGTEDVLGPLTTRKRDSETGADVSGVKCLSVHQHLPPGILPPWAAGVPCSNHLPPCFSPKQVQGKRREQASCCLPGLALAPCQSGEGGAAEQGPTHSTLSRFLFPQNKTQLLLSTTKIPFGSGQPTGHTSTSTRTWPHHTLHPGSLLL